MATTYLIDSNVLIDYASKKFEPIVEQKLDFIFDQSFNYSVISRIEVLGYNTSDQILNLIENFLATGSVYYVTEEVCQKTILIRRQLPKIKMPDLIIASTALVNNFTLQTRTTEDFKNITELSIADPWTWDHED